MTEKEQQEDLSLRLECIRMINNHGYTMSRAQEYYDFIKGKRFVKPRVKKPKTVLTSEGEEIELFSSSVN